MSTARGCRCLQILKNPKSEFFILKNSTTEETTTTTTGTAAAMLSLCLLLLSLTLRCVLGDVAISSPKKGATYTIEGGSLTIPVKWIDDTNYPTLDKVTYYTISLCYGPASSIVCPYIIGNQLSPDAITKTVDDQSVFSYDAIIPQASVGDGQFYIQVFLYVDGKGDTIHYSPRFNLKGMSGAATFTYTAATQPPAQTQINTGDAVTVATSIDSASFSITYTKQTGRTRFAPMQMQPNTKVTAKTWTTRFATSAVTFYSKLRNSLQQDSTITPGRSYLITSDVNYASAAPMPSEVGWYKPSKRLSLSARKMNI